MKTRRIQGSTIYEFKNTYVYAEDIIAALGVVVIFLLGAMMVQLGKQMDVEVERQRQVEMTEIAHDQMVNKEVTK